MKHFKIRQSITDRSSNAVRLYLKDISKYKLLTIEEESELVEKMLKGDIKAKETLISSNLRFVVSIAKQYQNKGLEFPDLISAGNEGLIKACSKFNPKFNCRFLSYAGWWIRNSILKNLILYGKTIRIPTTKLDLINKITKYIDQFLAENEMEPSIEDISKKFSLNSEYVEDLLSYSNISITPDTVYNEDGDLESIYDTLVIDDNNDSDSTLQTESKQQDFNNILKASLNDIEYRVITKLFGINGPEKTIEEVSNYYNITKERIRQIKYRAINKLRKSDQIQTLYNYL